MDSKLKAHPDYSEGYFATLRGEVMPAACSAEYRAGSEAGQRAADLFAANGFKRTGNAEFALRIGEQ